MLVERIVYDPGDQGLKGAILIMHMHLAKVIVGFNQVAKVDFSNGFGGVHFPSFGPRLFNNFIFHSLQL